MRLLWTTGTAFWAAAGLVETQGAYLNIPESRNVLLDGAFKSPLEIGDFNGGGREVEKLSGHLECGGERGSTAKSLLEYTAWGPFQASAKYSQGETVEFEVIIEQGKHNYGWFEFRLCIRKSEDAVTTQDCLNEHVLEFDEEFTKRQHQGEMRNGLSSPADMVGTGAVDPDHTKSRCSNIDSTPVAPYGSCCNSGGGCSTEEKNKHRWVLPKPNTNGPNGASKYTMRYRLPESASGDFAVLQMYYQKADYPGEYPSGIWNCADLQIAPKIEEQSSLAGPIIGGVMAALLVVGAVLYARNTLLQEASARSGVSTADQPKKGWFRGFFDRTSAAYSTSLAGSKSDYGQRNEYPLSGQSYTGQSYTGQSYNAQSFTGNTYFSGQPQVSSPVAPNSPRGKGKVLLQPPSSQPLQTPPSLPQSPPVVGGGGRYGGNAQPQPGFYDRGMSPPVQNSYQPRNPFKKGVKDAPAGNRDSVDSLDV